MFVNIIHFPPIKAGKDAEFRAWFSWSNEQYARHKGFISRTLLKFRKGGAYISAMEHESYKTFIAMNTSPTQVEAHKRVESLFDGNLSPEFFDVIVE